MTQMTARILRPAIETMDFDATGQRLYDSARRVQRWVEDHRYEAYEPFDCLSSPLGHLTRVSPLLDRLLQQVGRQSPVNFRPLLGVKPLPSTWRRVTWPSIG
jgi:hypothetical protein